MILKRTSIFLLFAVLVAFMSCEPNNPYDIGPVYDEAGNLAKDSLLIVEYLETAEIDSLYRIHDPNGVVIIVQEEGAGSRPTTGNVVYTNYTGSLMNDGSVFDTNIESVARENEIYDEDRVYDLLRFQIGGGTVIQGWDIAFRRLRPGSKSKLIIPSTWGYRDEERPKIPVNSILIFDVELKGID